MSTNMQLWLAGVLVGAGVTIMIYGLNGVSLFGAF